MSDENRCQACGEFRGDRDKDIERLKELLREVESCGVTWSGRTYREVQIPKALSEEIRKVIS